MSGDRRNKLLSLTDRGGAAASGGGAYPGYGGAGLSAPDAGGAADLLGLTHRYLDAIREETEPLLAQPVPEEWEEGMKIKLSDHFTYGRLLRFTLPSVVMMVIASIYSVVDGLFVSNLVGDMALSAVNIIFPLSP